MDALGVVGVDGILLNQVILDDDSIAELSCSPMLYISKTSSQRNGKRQRISTHPE